MSDKIIFKKCEFTIDEEVSEKCSPFNYDSVTELGFAVTKFKPLCIKGKHITRSAILKLLNILSISNPVDSAVGHPSTIRRQTSVANEDDCNSNSEDSFIIIQSTKTNHASSDVGFITDGLAGLNITRGTENVNTAPDKDPGHLEGSEKLLHTTDEGKEVCCNRIDEAQSVPIADKLFEADETLNCSNIQSCDTIEGKDQPTKNEELIHTQKKDEPFFTEIKSSAKNNPIDDKDDFCQSRTDQTRSYSGAEKLEVCDHKIACPAMQTNSDFSMQNPDDLNKGQILEKKERSSQIFQMNSSMDYTKVQESTVDNLKQTNLKKQTNDKPMIQNNLSVKNIHLVPLPQSQEDLISEESDDEEKIVLNLKEKHFIAACNYFKIDLKKYSQHVKARGEYEITLGKEAESDLILKLRDFKCVEVMFSSYEEAYSAAKSVLPNFKDISVSFGENIALLFGSKKNIQSAKSAFLSSLGNQDDITIYKNEKLQCINYSTSRGATSDPYEDSVVKQSLALSKINQKDAWRDSTRSQLFESKSSIGQISKKDTERPCFKGHSSNLKVYILNTNITQLDVDIIVNAANRHLQHAGGVAKAISIAAGDKLNEECYNFISSNGPLAVTDVFISTGGRLKVNQVMHAVGPRWEKYLSWEKNNCLTDLRRTVLRCLVEASRLYKTSIALPSISAALFKVPKDLCVKCYMEAVKSFDDFAGKLRFPAVEKIYFVDVDDIMVKMIFEQFRKEWSKPVNNAQSQEDFKFAQTHLSKKDQQNSTIPQKKTEKHSHEVTKPQGGSHMSIAQQKITPSNGIDYQINSITVHIGTRPATTYGSKVVVVGKVFDELSGIQKFSAKSAVKFDKSFPHEKDRIKCFTLTKPGSMQTAWIYRLYPNPESPESVTKAFQNLKGLKEIQAVSLVFSSEILYPKTKKSSEINNKTIPRFAQMVYEFAEEMSNTVPSMKSIYISTSEGCIPQMQKVFISRMDKLGKGQEKREKRGLIGEIENSRSNQGDNDYSMAQEKKGACGGNRLAPLVYPHNSVVSSKSTGFDLQQSNTNFSCPICYDINDFTRLPCCEKLICYVCFDKVAVCPFCKAHLKVLIGNQPDGEMSCRRSYFDVKGYEGFGSFEINYNIFEGIQTMDHPSPGTVFASVRRTAYLPATDQGLEALRLLRVAFLRRLIFTIDVSNTTRSEGVVWNIHHKTSATTSTHGFPDPSYLMRLKEELKSYGITPDTMSEYELRETSEFIKRVYNTSSTPV